MCYCVQKSYILLIYRALLRVNYYSVNTTAPCTCCTCWSYLYLYTRYIYTCRNAQTKKRKTWTRRRWSYLVLFQASIRNVHIQYTRTINTCIRLWVVRNSHFQNENYTIVTLKWHNTNLATSLLPYTVVLYWKTRLTWFALTH